MSEKLPKFLSHTHMQAIAALCEGAAVLATRIRAEDDPDGKRVSELRDKMLDAIRVLARHGIVAR
jgi:hypothetical protein